MNNQINRAKRWIKDHKIETLVASYGALAFTVGYVSGRIDGRDFHKVLGFKIYKHNDDPTKGFLVTNTRRKINKYDMWFAKD